MEKDYIKLYSANKCSYLISVGGFKPIGSGVDGDKAYLIFEQNADVQKCLSTYYESNTVTEFIRAYTETRKIMREAIANRG